MFLPRHSFDEAKATQAAAFLLGLAKDQCLNYMALIKLLYRADREALRRWGSTITTDKYVSMKNGPVTSIIYDRIKSAKCPGTHPTLWASYIQPCPDQFFVRRSADPGTSELSRAEERLLTEIFAERGNCDPFELADETHREFPEWDDPGASSTPIEIADIVKALQLSDDEAAHIASQIEAQRAALALVE